MRDFKFEKRKEVRFPATDALISASLRPEETDNDVMGSVIDKSVSGFQIRTSEEITSQTIVFLTITEQSETNLEGSERFLAITRWSKKAFFVGGFDIGVEILGFETRE
jgi:hypothetical protein